MVYFVGTIDLLIKFLTSTFKKKVASKPRISLIAPSIMHIWICDDIYFDTINPVHMKSDCNICIHNVTALPIFIFQRSLSFLINLDFGAKVLNPWVYNVLIRIIWIPRLFTVLGGKFKFWDLHRNTQYLIFKKRFW